MNARGLPVAGVAGRGARHGDRTAGGGEKDKPRRGRQVFTPARQDSNFRTPHSAGTRLWEMGHKMRNHGIYVGTSLSAVLS